jgi:hypothetical protein
MSPALTAPADAALVPVRAALLAAADAAATVARSNAEQQRDEVLARARSTAAELLAAARAEGAAEASAAAGARIARSRGETRLTVLAAQRTLYDDLRKRCRTAATDLVGSPGYEGLKRSLVERARAQLGPEAVVTESPDGGIFAIVGCRRLDLSLPTLAERALARSAGEVAQLWTL